MQFDRSRFYSLEPGNLGTCLSEALSSYVTRLAEAHCISVGKLINYGLAPYFGKHYLNEYASKGGTGFYKFSYLVNGRGKIAREFAEIVAKMTLRNDIENMTFLKVGDVIPDKGLLRRNRSWCPTCLDQARRSSSTIIEPLIWNIKPVKYCPIHETFLEECCWNCGLSSYALNRKHRNGFCSHCQAWLGGISTSEEVANDDDHYISREIGNLISELPGMNPCPTRENLFEAIRKITEVYAQGKVKKLAGLLNVPNITLRGWCKGEHVPEIVYTLAISRGCSLSLNKFLLGDVNIVRHDLVETNSRLKLIRKPRRKVNWHKIGQRLNLLTAQAEPSYSLTSTASLLGVDRRMLVQHFPDTCERIMEEYRNHKSRVALERIIEYRCALDHAVKDLLAHELYPSRRKVEELSGRSALLHEAKLSDYWSLLKQENIESFYLPNDQKM